ncbi:MAG: tRNA preQ1(34) S-adenosylmethionine ribosyltransferase-isomerase QueA [Planctomycetes bacterium]|nr:tRNA preQ1(34) S-adenosylmethionine ribosyltransferase-isomerase QueA [Planctomycetota bacterium]
MSELKKSDFHYELPEELIAQQPHQQRDQCRLLHLNSGGKISHHLFYQLRALLPSKGLLVLNDTKVIPARVPIRRASGAKGEMLIQHADQEGNLIAIGRPKRLKVGEEVLLENHTKYTMKILEKREDGFWKVRILPDNLWPHHMNLIGEIPLPPYIEREHGPTNEDTEQYQSVFSKHPGSAAAPTASLHFTEEMLKSLQEQGIEICHITHHVGSGTFLPMRVDDPSLHVMHPESYSLSEESSQKICKAKAEKTPIIAVGTTVVRALESAASEILKGKKATGETQLFIYPPYEYQIVDELITNFHLPESTLLMLVSALAGTKNIQKAYLEAVKEKYKFFSYGDAMYLSKH